MYGHGDSGPASLLTIGGFLDEKHRPTTEEIRAALGTKAGHWQELVRRMSEAHGVKGELEFGGAKYGWALEFRKGARPLTSLFPGKDSLIVLVVLGKDAVDLADRLDLGRNVRRVFDDARQLRDGRWLWIPVNSLRDSADVLKLVAAKLAAKRTKK